MARNKTRTSTRRESLHPVHVIQAWMCWLLSQASPFSVVISASIIRIYSLFQANPSEEIATPFRVPFRKVYIATFGNQR